MLKRVLAVVLSAVIVLSGAVLSANATETDNRYDLNDYGLHAVKPTVENNMVIYYDENGQEVDITANNRSVSRYSADMPQSFDLRAENRLTSIKDQGGLGLCWDFASTSSIESNILSQPELLADLGERPWETLDLSEAGNAWYIHTNVEDENSVLYGSFIEDPAKGTNGAYEEMVALGMSSGYGAYPEELLPYSQWYTGYTESMRFYSDYRLREHAMIEFSDVEYMKLRLMEHGATTVSYNDYKENYNVVDGMECYYDNGNPILDIPHEGAHAISIIGWDDNFSRENFCEEMRPENDGAWLCKNSWSESGSSTKEGYEGCLWLSYETAAFRSSQFVVQNVEEFDNIYQNEVASRNYLEGSNSAANVFTAESNEVIEQVCFTSMGYSDMTIEIYKLSDGYTSPVDGECVASFEASVDYSGTHCIDCPEPVALNEGDVFSVVITDEAGFCVYYSYEAFVDYAGLGYVTDEYGDWVDTADVYGIGYPCIKAYTKNKDSAVYKDKLSQSIENAENISIGEYLTQEIVDELFVQLKNAKIVFVDESASQNTVDNMTCVLNSCVERIEKSCIQINSYDDFVEYYNKVTYENFNFGDRIELNTDLDLSSFSGFTPLYFGREFKGVFDGNNHTISGLKVNTKGKVAGFFSRTANATIMDVTFENCDFTGEWSSGAVAGSSETTTFINCNVKDSRFYSKVDCAGTISGYDFDSVFENCNVSNCTVIGLRAAGVYTYTPPQQCINCTNKDITLVSTSIIVNDNGGMVTMYSQEDGVAILTMENDKYTIENLMYEIVDLKSDSVTIVKNGDKYEFETESDGEVLIEISFKESEPSEFGYIVDIRNRSVELLSYFGESTDVVFPADIGSVPVVSISSEFGFYTENPITSITFKGAPKTISSFAFSSMEALESVVFEEGVEVIGDEIFSYCPMLKTVTLPNSLTEIGQGAFALCENLEEVHFGNNLKNIRAGVFLKCTKLKNIELPDSVELLESNAFMQTAATSVVFGKNIGRIDDNSVGYTSYMDLSRGFIKIPDFTVYGYKGTEAENYAEKNGFNFVDITDGKPEIADNGFDYSVFVPGDVNLDGVVSILDATEIQMWLASMIEFSSIQQNNAFLGGSAYDGITIVNATKIQMFLAKLTPELNDGPKG